jgi:hypothetical protein
MDGHTREERWYIERERRRKKISDYYKSKRIARWLQEQLGIENLQNFDPWKFDAGPMREMAQLLRRSYSSIKIEREKLDLTPKVSIHLHDWESRILKWNGHASGYSEYAQREIMSHERAVQVIDDMLALRLLSPGSPRTCYFPKYYKELVLDKGIRVVFGAAKFPIHSLSSHQTKFDGSLLVLHAREIRGSWLWNDNLRAFKVIVLPDKTDRVYKSAVGYAVRSTLTGEIKVAFHEDINKAVSLCKRRVRAEVLKRMEV